MHALSPRTARTGDQGLARARELLQDALIVHQAITTDLRPAADGQRSAS
jgi:hypothetical protein